MTRTTQVFTSTMNTSNVMKQVTLALVPGLLMMVWINPLWILQPMYGVIGALLAEAAALQLRQRHIRFYLQDYSAVLTGLLLGICLPPESPWWLGFAGGGIAIALGKQVFGGLGTNPFNPAMVGYIALLLGFPSETTQWQYFIDDISGATLLDRSQTLPWSEWFSSDIFLKTSLLNLAFALGGLWLIQQRIIRWAIPLSILTGFLAIQCIYWTSDSGASPMHHLLLGGLLFGAFFIATDPVSAPVHTTSQWLTGLAIGLLTGLIRHGTQYPEGFAFAVLFMNIAGTSIDTLIIKVIRPKRR